MGELTFPAGMPDDGTCMAFYDREGIRCSAPAVCVALIGCENEFIRWNRLCARCLAELQAGRKHSCLRCWQITGVEHDVQLLELRMDLRRGE